MKKELIAIAAADQNGVIGRGNEIPWKLSTDMNHFKKTTMGHTLLMGRKTFTSIGRPLPGRRNAVLTRKRNWNHPGVDVYSGIEQFLEDGIQETVYVSGGAEVYKNTLFATDRILFTRVLAEVEGDVHLPYNPEELTNFELVEEKAYPETEKDQYPFIIQTYERRARFYEPL